MISINVFRQIALALPEATEQPHFEKASFRVGKKIFATLDVKNQQACLKLSSADQDVFTVFDKTIIFPVSGKWGQQGWTLIDLKKIRKAMLTDALTTAYSEVAPARLRAQIKQWSAE
jgi:predicted DNA-binding protein (MmcQ/YjbR family)